MATRTIIIESNRNVSYQNEISNNPLNLSNDNFPNNRWTTHIPDGIPINVGDQINLEASMINSVGSGDEVMEFIGKSGIQVSNNPLSDRSVSLGLNYYITNRFQFNFNLPKSQGYLNYDFNTADYGSPAFYSFAEFLSNYPYECLEGFSTDVSVSPRVYTRADDSLNPSYMNPCLNLNAPDDKRMYIGVRNYIGPYYKGSFFSSVENNVWEKFRLDVLLETPTGFLTPSSVAETLTSQLHQRNGNALSWTNLNVSPKYFGIDSGNGTISSVPLPGITDSTYLTFPTSTGRLFYEREDNNWSSAFAGERDSRGNLVPVGTNYNNKQGQENYYHYIMTSRPEYYAGMTAGFSKAQLSPCGSEEDLSGTNYQNFTLHTGNNDALNKRFVIDGKDVGLLGNNVVLLDELPKKLAPIQYFNTTPPEGIFENTQAGVLDLVRGNGITTNIIWSLNNIDEIVNSYINESVYVNEETATQDPNNFEFLKAHAIPFYFGRVDDNMTNVEAQRLIYLPAVGINSDPPPVGNNLGDSYFTSTLYNEDGSNISSPCMYGRVFQDIPQKHEHACHAFQYDTSFTPQNAMNNSIIGMTNLFPHNNRSKFQTAHPQGDLTKLKEIWSQIPPLETFGNKVLACIVPVFYRDQATATASRTGTNAYLVPFVCFIYQSSEYDVYPYPVDGEFCLWDTSLYNCELSMISTTQKTGLGNVPYLQPDINSPENTRPEQYMPYVYAGASDSLINFDAGYGKFTLSQFHTATKTGNGQYQNPTEPPNTNPEQDILTVSEQESHFCTVDQDFIPTSYSDIQAQVVNQPVISAQSGIAISSISIPFELGQPLNPFDVFTINKQSINFYKGSLPDKMGFLLEQLSPFYGNSQSSFNRGNYNRYLGTDDSISVYQKEVNMVKPFTTNAYISSAEQISLSQMTGIIETSAGNTINLIIPSAKIGGNVSKQASTNATSDLLIASNLPKKLSFPYLVVYTDIVRNTDYYGGPNGHEKLNAISYITRNYAEGDYFYSFTTNWNYTADSNYVITSILTDIRLPDGRPAPIDENSSVIYKIQKPQVMPMLPPIQQLTIPKNEKREQDKDA